MNDITCLREDIPGEDIPANAVMPACAPFARKIDKEAVQ